MHQSYRWAVPLVVLLAACAGDGPIAPRMPAARPSSSSSVAACTDVQGTGTFTLDLARSAAAGKPVFSGPVEGDLTGTFIVVHEGLAIPPPPNPAGATHLFSEMIFLTDQFGTFSGNQPFVSISLTDTINRFSGRLTITDGDQITSGSLSLHGTIDASDLPTGEMSYSGSICS